jgi:hypothetical protein
MEQHRTIAPQLERDRLEHRMRRIELVVAALGERAVFRRATMGTTPAPLRQGITSLELEIVAIRRRLDELGTSDARAAAAARQRRAKVDGAKDPAASRC